MNIDIREIIHISVVRFIARVTERFIPLEELLWSLYAVPNIVLGIDKLFLGVNRYYYFQLR